jgi:hypothetical protein
MNSLILAQNDGSQTSPKVSSKLVRTKQVKDRSDPNGGTKTKGYIPIVSFFCYGKYVYVGGVWYNKGHQCHKGSPYSPVNKPQRRIHDPLSDALEGGMRPFTQSIGASSTTQLEAPNKPTKLSHTKNELGWRLLPSRVPRNPIVTSNSRIEWGIQIPLVEV